MPGPGLIEGEPEAGGRVGAIDEAPAVVDPGVEAAPGFDVAPGAGWQAATAMDNSAIRHVEAGILIPPLELA